MSDDEELTIHPIKKAPSRYDPETYVVLEWALYRDGDLVARGFKNWTDAEEARYDLGRR